MSKITKEHAYTTMKKFVEIQERRHKALVKLVNINMKVSEFKITKLKEKLEKMLKG